MCHSNDFGFIIRSICKQRGWVNACLQLHECSNRHKLFNVQGCITAFPPIYVKDTNKYIHINAVELLLLVDVLNLLYLHTYTFSYYSIITRG